MSLAALVFVAWARKKGWAKQNQTYVEIMASLPLGKDVFFVLRCGPEVFALTSGSGGTRLISRWKYEEWKQYDGKTELPKNERGPVSE
jgi:acyl-CoA-binding protein